MPSCDWMLKMIVVMVIVVMSSYFSRDGLLVAGCSKEDRKTVMYQWNKVMDDMRASPSLTTYVAKFALKRLMARHPETAIVLKNVESTNTDGGVFTAHCLRMYNAFDMLVNLMGNPDALNEALDHLAEQHAARPGVKLEHFLTFAEIVADGSRTVLDDFDTMSWDLCLRPIVHKLVSKLPCQH